MFERTPDEVQEFSRSQLVTLNRGRGSNVKYAPFAFTELGVAMLHICPEQNYTIDAFSNNAIDFKN